MSRAMCVCGYECIQLSPNSEPRERDKHSEALPSSSSEPSGQPRSLLKNKQTGWSCIQRVLGAWQFEMNYSFEDGNRKSFSEGMAWTGKMKWIARRRFQAGTAGTKALKRFGLQCGAVQCGWCLGK